MKRIMAFILCWVMLLSQMAMVAEAMQTKEQSDILYLEENGIHVEDGGQVFMDNAPLGRSDDTERYAPSIPKFIPEALKNLGLMPKEEEQLEIALGSIGYDDTLEPLEWETFSAFFNKDKVMLYAYAGDDAETVYFKGAMGFKVEVFPTVTPLYYALSQPVSDELNYAYVRAEDITFSETRRPDRVPYYTDPDTGITVHMPELPSTRVLRVSPVAAERAPMREIPGREMGERTLIASYRVGAVNRDGENWNELEETEICFTIPELPEIGTRGCYYAECVDTRGEVEELTVYPYVWSNVLSVEAPLDQEIFVYAVDYPDNAGIFGFLGDVEIYLSEKYDEFNTGRPFSEVVDIVISNPDELQVTPIYNDEGKTIDWEFNVLKPFYSLEEITFVYRDSGIDPRSDWRDDFTEIGSVSTEKYTWSKTSIANGQYAMLSEYVTIPEQCTIKSSATVTLRVGAEGTTYKKTHLRLAKGMIIKGTLYLTVDTNCGGSSVYRYNPSDAAKKDLNVPMLYPQEGGKLICIGSHNTKYEPHTSHPVTISGNGNINTSRALVHVIDKGSYAKFFNTKIIDADNLSSDAGHSKRGGAIYINTATANVYLCDYTQIINCNADKGGGIYIGAGTVSASKSVEKENDTPNARIYISGCKRTREGAGIYMAGGTLNQFAGASWSVHDNTATSKGGALYAYSGTINCAGGSQMNFYSNTANHGGGIYVGGIWDDSNITKQTFNFNGGGGSSIGGFDIYDNTANYNGGGIMAENCTVNFSTDFAITNNLANGTGDNGNGGGVCLNGWKSSAVTTVNNGFYVYGNKANTRGGGVYVSGSSLTMTKTASASISSGTAGERADSTPYNYATYGGGIYVTGSTVEAKGCGVSVKNNQANRGGGFYVHSGTVKWTTDGSNSGYYSVQGNTASNKGGGLYINGGTFTCESGSQMNVYDNTAIYGGGAYIGGKGVDDADTNQKSITFNGGGGGGWDVYNNKATSYNGGGLMVEVCSLTVNSPVWLSHNKANGETSEGRGGNIFIGGWGVTTKCTVSKDLYIYGGTAKEYGGGIFIADGNSTLQIDGGITTISKDDTNSLGDKENSAPNGGAICIFNGTLVNNSTLNIYNNKATSGSGGAIYMGGGTFTSTGTMNVNGNTATSNGGAVYLAANSNYSSTGLLSMTGNSANGAGGGFYATAASKFEVTGPSDYNNSIGNNTAYGQGGGIWTINTSVKLQNTNVYGNHSKTAHAGGMIFLRDESNTGTYNIELTNCEIKENICDNESPTTSDDDRGAGIYAERVNVTVDKCTIQGNKTPYGRGGGIFFRSSDGRQEVLTIKNNTVIQGNSAKGNSSTGDRGLGGGICVDKNSVVNISDSTISGNEAEYCGGGIYTACPITISDTVIGAEGEGNTVLLNHGGGIYSKNAAVSISGGSVGYNVAQSQGGGIYVYKADLTVSGGTNIHNNSTNANHGGGIYAYFGNVTLGENTKVQNNTAYGAAGGIYFYNRDDATERTLSIGANSEISGNKSTTEISGGVQMDNAKMIMETGAQVYSNTCAKNGGGVYLINSELEMKGTASIHDNTATLDGGGVYISTGKITVSGTPSIYGNYAKGKGGGIYSKVKLELSGTLTVGNEDATKGNKADSDGGGIYGELDVSLTGVKVLGNYAKANGGGVCVVDGKTVTLSGVSNINGNGAGANGGGVYIKNGTITTAATTTMTFDGNYAGENGGGVYLNSATATLTNAQFKNNKALGFGGGIYSNHTKLDLNSGNSFDGNMAGVDKDGKTVAGCGGSGGGIWFGGADKTLTLNAVEMKNNSAHRGEGVSNHGNGGGVYMASNSSLKLEGAVKIHDNHADNAYGGGICLSSASLAIDVVNGVAPHIYSNSALSGGGIAIVGTKEHDWSNLTMTIGGETAAEGNTASLGGGVATINVKLTVGSKIVIQNNRASSHGGGIYCSGADMKLNAATINSNYAGGVAKKAVSATASETGGNGGGIYFTGSGKTLELNNATIKENHALANGTTNGNGGGVYMDAGTTLKVTADGSADEESSYIVNNEATNNGGGLYMVGGTTTPSVIDVAVGVATKLNGNNHEVNLMVGDNSSTRPGNQAANGGGIYLSGGVVTLTGDHELFVRQNKATNGNGGGMVLDGTTLNVNGSVGILVGYNTASNNGGGIAVLTAGMLKDTSTGRFMIYTNTATNGNGGGVWCAGSIETNGMNIGFNTQNDLKNPNKAVNGGGLYLTGNGSFESSEMISVVNNQASGDGGGIYLDSGTLELNKGVTLHSNMAHNNGGGIYTKANLTLGANCQIGVQENTTMSPNFAKNGGGIYVAGGETILQSGASVFYNEAGLKVSAALADKKWTLTKTTVGGSGGGIYVDNATLTLDSTADHSTVVKYNKAVASGTNGGNGGGVYVASGGLKLTGTTSILQQNSAVNGGGLYMEKGTLTMAMDKVTDSATGKEIEYDFYILDNTATGNGGGVYFGGTSGTITLAMDTNKRGRLLAKENDAVNGGGMYISKCTINSNQAVEFKLERNEATLGGGMFVGDSTTTVNLKACAWIYQNKATDGGGIYLDSGALNMTGGVTLHSNIASNNGGGIYTKVDLTLGQNSRVGYHVSDTDKRGNYAKLGGGIFVKSGTTTLQDGAYVRYNEAGVVVTTTVTNDVWSITGKEEVGGSGGGIYISGGSSNGSVVMHGGSSLEEAKRTRIEENTCYVVVETYDENGNPVYVDGLGGGVYMSYGTLTLDDGAVIKANTAGLRGGGIAINGDGDEKLTIMGASSIIENQASVANGGGIWMANGTLTIEGESVIARNTAQTLGGGIYTKGGTLDIKNAFIEYNTAMQNGGGIYLNVYNAKTEVHRDLMMTVTDSKIWHNTAYDPAADDGTGAGNGGGIYVKVGEVILTGDTEISNNYTEYGGGLYVIGGKVTAESGVVIKEHRLRMSDKTTQMANGCGLWMNGGEVLLEGATITDNHGASDGGGIRLAGGTLKMLGAKIQGNTCKGRGGGIYMTGGTLMDVDATATDATIISGNVAGSHGGGFYCGDTNNATTQKSSGSVALCNTMFDGNYAGATMTVNEDKTVTYSASGKGGNGGGICFVGTVFTEGQKTLTLNGIEVKNNVTYRVASNENGRGGGVAVVDCNLIVTGATHIHGNKAAHNGGGVYVSRTDNTDYLTPDVTMERQKDENTTVLIENNTAGYQGGGVYVYGSNLNAEYVTISGNKAVNHGGGLLAVSYGESPSYLTLTDMKCIITNSEISNNVSDTHAGGAWIEGYQNEATKFTNVTVDSNVSGENGGGLYLRYTKLTMDGTSKISGNHAGATKTETDTTVTYSVTNSGGNGGGVFVHEDSEFTMLSGTISSNKAYVKEKANGCGGGIYATKASGTDATVSVSGGTITANTAQKEGGGIYLHNNSTLTVKELTKSPIYENTAGTAGDDIYAVGPKDGKVSSTLIMPATTANGVAEYWFADYAAAEKVIPNVFPSDYLVENGLYNPGRYNEYTTPVTYARRSFEEGTDPSTAYLALKLATAEDLFVDLTLTKKISDAVGKVVEPTTFIFYIKGVDDASFLLPVAIHLDPEKNGTEGSVTIRDLPVGFYDICEAEGWSWRYAPSTAANSADTSKVLQEAENGDGYVEVRVTRSAGTHSVTFTNQLDSKLWLTDADYLPFLPAITGVSTVSADDEDEEDGE